MPDGLPVKGDCSVRDVEHAVSAIVLWATSNDIRRETMRRARCDLPSGHVWLLARLDTCAPVRIGELAAVLGIDNSTLTPQAQRLERDGLVVRETDPSDGRAALLRVTRAGRQLLERLHASRLTLLADRLDDWPAAERAHVAAILVRFAAAL
jgi:DNA-binding MarR family transcriptional regulator